MEGNQANDDRDNEQVAPPPPTPSDPESQSEVTVNGNSAEKLPQKRFTAWSMFMVQKRKEGILKVHDMRIHYQKLTAEDKARLSQEAKNYVANELNSASSKNELSACSTEKRSIQDQKGLEIGDSSEVSRVAPDATVESGGAALIKAIRVAPNSVKFTCAGGSACGELFDSRYHATVHSRHCKLNTNRQMSKCPVCLQSYSSELNLKSHMRQIHKAIFASKSPLHLLARKLGANREGKIGEPNDDGKTSQKPSLLQRKRPAYQIITDEETLNEMFPDTPVREEAITTNDSTLKSKQSSQKSALTKLQCFKCKRNFKTVINLDKHKNFCQGVGSNLWECDICGESFGTGKERKAHIALQHQESNMEETPTESSGNLENNLADQSQQIDPLDAYTDGSFGIFKCEDCGTVVKSIGAIKRHYKANHNKNLEVEELLELQIDDTRNQVEDEGSKTVSDVSDGRSRNHGEIYCPICGKIYVARGNYGILRTHIEKFHKGEISEDALDKFLGIKRRKIRALYQEKCILCTKKFRTKVALLNHYHHVHRIHSTSLHQTGKVLEEIESLHDKVSSNKPQKSTPNLNGDQDTLQDQFGSSEENRNSSSNDKGQLKNLEPVVLDNNFVEDEIEISTSVESPKGFLNNSNVERFLQGNLTSNRVPTRNVNEALVSRSVPGFTTAAVTDVNAPNYSINGLDDLLTFDGVAASETPRSSGHSVCKICFESFTQWPFLQTHYARVHKLNVLNHVS